MIHGHVAERDIGPAVAEVTGELGAPVRALIVVPVATQRGGAEVQLQQLLENLLEARVEPTVAFLRSGPMVEWCRERGVPAVSIAAGRLRQPRMFGRAVRALIKLAGKTHAQVVIGWMAKGQVYGGLAAVGARLPSVWFQTDRPSRRSPLDRLATSVPVQLVICNSRGTEVAQQRLAPRRAMTVIYPAVDRGRFDAARIGAQHAVRRRLGLPQDGPIFGSVGRLQTWKGFHILLEAADEVFERHPDATVAIVGGRHELEPAYAEELHERAARLASRGRVLLVGQQPNPEEWMQAMDVFVHTSRGEPFGMVVIEAMALGKPVIAAAEGGPTEVITPGVDGLLTPYGDPQALAAAIVRLLDDDDLRLAVGHAAVHRSVDFSVEDFARRLGAAITDVVAQASLVNNPAPGER